MMKISLILGATDGSDQRTSDIRDHSPIKGKETHAQTRVRAKQLVDNDVLGCNPADPVENAQRGEEVTWHPVPDEGARQRDAEELLSRDVPFVVLTVTLMQRVEQCAIDERAWPDHARRPDEELAKQTTERETDDLGGEDEHDLIAEAELLGVEHFLGRDNVGGVGTTDDDVGHDSDDDVLFDVERAWVERPNVAESAEASGREDFREGLTQRQGRQLSSNASDDDRRV